jgi:hypothetical protein
VAAPIRLTAVEEGLGSLKQKMEVKALTSRYHVTLLAVRQQ